MNVHGVMKLHCTDMDRRLHGLETQDVYRGLVKS